MNSGDNQTLQNVLSISTAANNRYLLHFNSLHSLTQWTAGIRLAMFEQSTLQEAYTGSIIAGKGKHLNSIRQIMDRARFPTEDWVRVRFGAGTPWRRCWCVVSPPDEKEIMKIQKAVKKRSAYQKSPSIKGDIKFYETRKVTKKTMPVATIKDAFAAYAIYPQSKELIDQSTLVKVEGRIVIHSNPESTTEGFVFLMPEVHPAVTGFEIMLRFLLPIFDSFNLYGRPSRLIADVVDTRSLMFAMPSNRRYGYLDLIDVAGLIHTEGSQNWNEYDWRKQMKQLTAKRMSAPETSSRNFSADQTRRAGIKSNANDSGPGRTSFGGSNRGTGVRYSEDTPRSTPGSRAGSSKENGGMYSAPQSRNASDTSLQTPAKGRSPNNHQRASSDAYRPSRLSFDTSRPGAAPPPPPQHASQPRFAPAPPQDNVPSYAPQQGPAPAQQQGPLPPMHSPYTPQPQHQPSGSTDFSHNLYPASPTRTAGPAPQQPSQPPQPPQHSQPGNRQIQAGGRTSFLGRDEFPPVHGHEGTWGPQPRPSANDPFLDNGYHNESPPNTGLGAPFAPHSNQPFSRQEAPFNPVAAPPSFAHKSNAQPPVRPNQMPEMRRANSAIDAATLAQLKDANRATNEPRFGMATPPRVPRDDSQSYQFPPRNPDLHSSPSVPSMSNRRGPPPMGQTPLGPPPAMGGSNMLMPERTLPTIPGTPANEFQGYGLPSNTPLSPGDPAMERGSRSIYRKPVPTPSPHSSRSPNPAPRRSSERQY